MDESNPYQAPGETPARRPRTPIPTGPWRPGFRMIVGWAVVLLLNLPVPLMFGSSMTDADGKAGMAAAIVAVAAIGVVVCLRSRRVGMAAIVGGSAVALSQFVPVPHIAAGIVSVTIAQHLGFSGPRDETGLGGTLGPAGAFVVSALTASMLLAVAVGIGLLLQVVTPGRWWGRPASPEAGPEPADPA